MARISKKAICVCICFIFLSFDAIGQKEFSDARTGHSAKIYRTVFSPDNKTLASSSEDGMIIVWDIPTTKEIYRINPTEEENYEAMAFSPDGKILAGASKLKTDVTGEIKFWEAKTGKPLGGLDGSTDNDMAFSPDGKTLVANTIFEGLKIWDIATKKQLPQAPGGNSPLAFNKNGTLLAASSGEDSVTIWDMKTGREVRTIEGTGEVKSLVFNPLGNLLAAFTEITDEASGEQTQLVKVWRVPSGAPVKGFAKIETSGLCKFTADGRSLMVSKGIYYPIDFSYGNESILFYDPLTGKKQSGIATEADVSGKVGDLNPNHNLLAIIDYGDLDIHVFDLRKKVDVALLKGHTISVKSMAFSRDGKNILGGYADGRIISWNIAGGKISKIVSPKIINSEDPTDPATTFEKAILSSNSDYFTFAPGSDFSFFETGSGNLVGKTALPFYSPRGYAFSRDGKIAAVLGNETVSFYEIPNMRLVGKFLHRLPTQDSSFNQLAFNFDGKILAVADERDIIFWEVPSGKIIKTMTGAASGLSLNGEAEGISSFAFSPDNKFLVVAPSAYYSKTGYRIYDLATNEIAFTLDKQREFFAISPDGSQLATIGEDGGINLTNLASGKLIRTTKSKYDVNYDEAVLVYNADGSLLAVGGAEGIKLFRTATGEEIRAMK
jgi:WD40 repeat protein